jgi:hypothetical protein
LKRKILIGAAVALVGSIVVVAINRSGADTAEPTTAAAAAVEPTPYSTVKHEPEPKPKPEATAKTDDELRARFRELVADKQHQDATEALSQLCERDWKLLDQPEARSAVVELLVLVAELEGAASDRPFELVAAKLGTLGPDLLFELHTSGAGTAAGRRAEELLRDDKLRERGTAALRVAYDLRAAPNCDAVAIRLIGARQDGDQRAKTELERVHTCAQGAKCCMRGNERVAAVIRILDLKLGGGSAAAGPAKSERTAAPSVEPATPPGQGKVPTAPATATPATTPEAPSSDETATPPPAPDGDVYD